MDICCSNKTKVGDKSQLSGVPETRCQRRKWRESLARRIREKPREVPEAKSRVCFSGDRAFNGVKLHRSGKGALGDCVESSVSGKGKQGRCCRRSELESGEVETARVDCLWKTFCSEGSWEGAMADRRGDNDVPWNLGWTKRDEDRWQSVESGGQ